MASIWDKLEEVNRRQRRNRRIPKTTKRVTPTTNRSIARAVREVGTTTTKAAPKVVRAATRAAPRVDPEYARIRAQVERYERAKRSGAPTERLTGVRASGFDPSALRGSNGRSIGGFLQNLGRGGLDIITSVPAQAQLVGEAALYPVVSGFNIATGNRGPSGNRTARAVERQLNEDLRAAGTGIRKDYAYRWGPLLEGDLETFGARFYDNPTPTILDVAGGKAIIGRAPNAVRRVLSTASPGSSIGRRAARGLSIMSAEERAAFAKITGREIMPGPGGRYRPPRRVTSRIAREEVGKPNIGQRTVEVPRAAYSGDAIARMRQKGIDRLRESVVPRLEAAAERRQLPAMPAGTRQPALRTRVAARVSRPFTAEAKYARYQKGATREIQDLFRAKAEVEQARTMPDAARAIKALKRDRNVAGTTMRGLSTEEAAFALHRMDVLGEVKNGVRGRGGLTARQLRDQYVRRIEGGQIAARRAGKRTENATQQLQTIRNVPDELLDLTDTANPAVRRVRAAVEEARKLDAESQRMSVEAGVIRPETAARMAIRDSAIGVGGTRWGPDAIRTVTVAARRKTKGIKRRIAQAEKRGDRAEARRLKVELDRHIANTKGRIAAIRRDATRDTPELQTARAAAREADTRLGEARATGTPAQISAATRARDTYFKRLRKQEREALGFTSPRRPELVGTRGVYVPDRRVDVSPGGYTGPRPGGRFSGPDKARRSTGSLKARAGMDLNPNLVLHQAARAAQNYTGTISAKALDELIRTAAYLDPRTGRYLTGDRLKLLSAADAERVRLVHQGNLRKALKKLDELEEGKFLDDATVREVFADRVPEGARASDYIAIHRDAAEVWTESMTRYPVIDRALNLWKGGLLALSPRWYVNNTAGLALQYAVMAGPDIRSVFQATKFAKSRKLTRAAMARRKPNAVKDTLAADLTGGQDIPRAIAFGFQTNAKLEEAWRRAAFLNRAKLRFRDEGGRFRGLTDAEWARAIEHMPESMVRDIVRDIDFFIGNYRKFNKVEQGLLKRTIPFYSWLRVIGRLTIALPFRSPARAAAMSVLEEAQAAGINPEDKVLPTYMRGALRFGDKAVPTWGINPWQTLAPMIEAAGARQPAGAVAEEALGWVHPLAQLGVSQATGVNNFGRGVSTPPGTAAFGQDPEFINPVTGIPSRQRQRIPFLEALAQTVAPGQISLARRVAAGNRTPYDTTNTLELIEDFANRLGGGERQERLYRPESTRQGRRPSSINPYTAPLGIPIYDQDSGALTREAMQALREFKAKQKKRDAERRRAARR